MTIHGRLEAFETGTEGIIWSVVDPGLPGYDGLYTLHDDDRLQIIGRHDETLWAGTVKLEYLRNWQSYAGGETGQQAVLGMWVHGLQSDLSPEQWATMFMDRYRAVLHPAKPPAVHPYNGSSLGMADRLKALPEDQQRELYRYTMYGWLHFYSNGEFYSYAKDWQFSLDEIVRLIGAPTEAQIAAWKIYPKVSTGLLMPFDAMILQRIALLSGVYGGLNWKFHDTEAAANWLVTWHHDGHTAKDLVLGSIADIMIVRDAAAVPA